MVQSITPKNASRRLQYDEKLIEGLDMKTTNVLHNVCKHKPPSAQPTYKDKKADLIHKHVFCDFYKAHMCAPLYLYIYIYDIKARVLFPMPSRWCWPWPYQDSFLEADFVSADLALHGLALAGRHLYKWLRIDQGAPCP